MSILISSVTFNLRRSVARARRLGQYTLDEKIGEGGMGVGLPRRATRCCAGPRRSSCCRRRGPGEANLARFEREVQLTAQLTHPNTIAVYDYGRTPEGVFYYAMEYLDGIDLERPRPRRRAAAAGPRRSHPAAGLRGARARRTRIGLIHRDIKPANIVLSERGGMPDFVKVLDFGLVKEVSAAGRRVD